MSSTRPADSQGNHAAGATEQPTTDIWMGSVLVLVALSVVLQLLFFTMS